jgi:hypothetical protein
VRRSSPSMMRTVFVVLVVLSVSAAGLACAPMNSGSLPVAGSAPVAASPPVAGSSLSAAGPNDLVLRIERVGAIRAPGRALADLPPFSLYGDGRIISPGLEADLYPRPALPNLEVGRLRPAGLAQVLQAARSAGLVGPDRVLPRPLHEVADSPSIVFRLRTEAGFHTTTAPSLVDAPPATRERQALLTLHERLVVDRWSWLGDGLEPGGAAYAWDRLRVIAVPDDPASGPVPERARVTDWPATTLLQRFGEAVPQEGPGVRCGVLAGADLATLRPALEASHELTFWRSGDLTFRLLLRPLLPDESDCSR